ncbi:ABC transporter permease [Halogeometricum borinquense]|uniref:ABC transporter permease n=1 Tax=Halogeometricum borinquense TaxID=60847 RepID=A0A6C0UJT2_9EURY|nr:ABC transporter permease [Halogeometricum borinquense]QIB75477.1 ABC transporter permease [Halogeometricum borinquense]
MGSSNSGTAGYGSLAYAILSREVINWARYPVNAASVVFGQFFFFALIFFGGQAVSSQGFSDSAAGLVVGYFLWSLVGQSYQGTIGIITEEASWGTLERHFISPFGFNRVLFIKAIARMLRALFVSLAVLAMMVILTGTQLQMHVITVLSILLLTTLSVVGLGFAMGGVAVLYKRISSFSQLFSLVILGLVGAPVLDIPWLRVLPVVQGSAMLQQTMRSGVRLWQFDGIDIGILVGVTLVYFGIGFAVFHLTQRRARNVGVLGDY